MKLLLFLTNTCVIMGLFAFDYYSFKRVSETANVLKTLSQRLDIRGRQRYAVQKHYSQWLTGKLSAEQIIEEFQESYFFNQIEPEMPLSAVLARWPKLHLLIEKHQQLELLKASYKSIPLHSVSSEEVLGRTEKWSHQVITLLDSIQKVNVSLSNYLSEKISEYLKRTVFVNSFVLICLFSFNLTILYIHQRRRLIKSQTINQQLTQQKEFLKVSKQSLLSLMEDISRGKQEAMDLSIELQVMNTAMKRKNKEMEQFVYTISHDLKSPLVTIGGFAKKLAQELNHSIDEKQKHRLQRIQDNVNHMESLLIDLLNLSKVINQALEKSQLDTEMIINKQCEVLESLIASSGANIIIHKPLLSIYANSSTFSQCIINLLTNSMKYRDPNKNLNIHISTKQDKQFVWLVIQDNGVGIDEKYHQQIFRIFERLGSGEGTGVGLTIVKTIMEKHQGKVELSSKPGKGSEFRLAFPKPESKEKTS